MTRGFTGDTIEEQARPEEKQSKEEHEGSWENIDEGWGETEHKTPLVKDMDSHKIYPHANLPQPSSPPTPSPTSANTPDDAVSASPHTVAPKPPSAPPPPPAPSAFSPIPVATSSPEAPPSFLGPEKGTGDRQKETKRTLKALTSSQRQRLEGSLADNGEQGSSHVNEDDILTSSVFPSPEHQVSEITSQKDIRAYAPTMEALNIKATVEPSVKIRKSTSHTRRVNLAPSNLTLAVLWTVAIVSIALAIFFFVIH